MQDTGATHMPTLDEQRATKLSTLAVERLGRPLTPIEEELIRQSTSSGTSAPVAVTTRTATVDGPFLRWLATDPDAGKLLDFKGVRVRSLIVAGNLDFDNCTLTAALTFQDCDINGEILIDSAILRNLELEQCTLNGAVNGGNTVINGSLSFTKSISNHGLILDRLLVTGALSLAGSDFRNSQTDICLDGARITGSVLLSSGFKAAGQVRMHGARMGDLDCTGATFAERDGSFSLDGATINGDLTLSSNFNCPGEVRLPGSHILGNLECIDATIGSLICHNMIVDGDLMWTDIRNAAKARLSLVGVKVKGFRDQKSTWPSAGNLELEGLVYEQLTVHEEQGNLPTPKGELTPRLPFSAVERIEWINRQEADRLRESQPWMQLSRIAQSLGDEDGAHHVVYQLARHRAKRSLLPVRSLRIGFAWLREQPFRIALSILTILILCSTVFWSASERGGIAPRDKDSYAAWVKGQPYPAAFPTFNPVIYSLENELPLVKFGQDDKWAPDPAHKPVQLGTSCLLHWTSAFNSYSFLTFVRWLSIVLGWVQATVLAGALGNRFKS